MNMNLTSRDADASAGTPKAKPPKAGLTSVAAPAFAALAFAAFPLFAGEPVVIDERLQGHEIGSRLEILEDRTGRLTFEQVKSEKFARVLVPGKGEKLKEVLARLKEPAFVQSNIPAPGFGFTRSVFWARFTAENKSQRAAEFHLELDYPMIDHIDLFDESHPKPMTAGDHLPFRRRAVQYRNFVFPLQLDSGARRTYYLRLETTSSMNLPLAVWPPAALAVKINDEQMALGLFYGMTLVMILYNLFIFLSVRDRSYLLYVLFIVSFILMQLTLNGLAFQYLWPDWIWWANNSLPFFMFTTISSAALFTNVFLSNRETSPFFHKIMIGFAVCSLVCLSGSLFLDYFLSIQIATTLMLVAVTACMWNGIASLLRGYRPARFYLIAWAAVLLGGVLYTLKTFAVIPNTFITNNGAQIGFAMMVVLFSLGLADRINALREKLGNLNQEVSLARANLELIGADHARIKGELNEAKTQLVQAEKLSSLGQMVAGVAHEINNPVNYISGARQNLARELAELEAFLKNLTGDDPDAREVAQDFARRFATMGQFTADIKTGAEKITEINRALRSYSRLDPDPVENVRIDTVIDDSLVILRARIKRHAVERRYGETALITCHPSHLGQVFNNLIANASDAIDEKLAKEKAAGREFQGKILVSTGNASRNGREGIFVQVEDNGDGVPLEIRAKIMDAFFTTKPSGVGTGLGLAVCGKIVSDHGGALEVGDSAELGGASFRVWAPAHRA